MVSSLYWVSTLTFCVVLLIILINDLRVKKVSSESESNFRIMVFWVLFFCLQDSVWGLCASGIISSEVVLFLVSSFFHISTVLTTFFWLKYVLDYLGDRVRYKKVILLIDLAVILFELILIIWNFYSPILFYIKNGCYEVGPLRIFTFLNQYLVYLVIGSIAALVGIQDRDSFKEKNGFFAVFVFSLAPIMTGIFQLLYPNAPFYSIGYFLGCFIIHIFIVSRDREEASRSRILQSVAETYYSMHLFDLENNTCERLIEPQLLKNAIGSAKNIEDIILNAFRKTVIDDYLDIILEFTNISSLSARLSKKRIISCEYIGKDYGWMRMSLISIEKDNNNNLKKFMLTTQIIDAEKRAHIDLLFQSRNDQLTGLFNRRAFNNDIEKMEKQGIPEDFLLVSMDLNGLKVTNDTLGHAAGDELLIGASDCMKKVFSSYGKIYRTGGDEFLAVLKISSDDFVLLKEEFEKETSDWHGTSVNELSVSIGFASRNQMPNSSIHEICVEADRLMYENKKSFYMAKNMINYRGE